MIREITQIPGLAALVFALVAGCASYGGWNLKPGASGEGQVRQTMGRPALEWEESDGGKLLAYPRGPMGLHTYMVRIDGGGRLTRIEQVLDEDHFALIRHGMSEEDVLRTIGPPSRTTPFRMRNELAWDYRFRDLWGYPSIFSVIFGADRRVKTAVRVREESQRWPSMR